MAVTVFSFHDQIQYSPHLSIISVLLLPLVILSQGFHLRMHLPVLNDTSPVDACTCLHIYHINDNHHLLWPPNTVFVSSQTLSFHSQNKTRFLVCRLRNWSLFSASSWVCSFVTDFQHLIRNIQSCSPGRPCAYVTGEKRRYELFLSWKLEASCIFLTISETFSMSQSLPVEYWCFICPMSCEWNKSDTSSSSTCVSSFSSGHGHPCSPLMLVTEDNAKHQSSQFNSQVPNYHNIQCQVGVYYSKCREDTSTINVCKVFIGSEKEN